MKAEQLEIERLRREVTKLKAERDILKAAAFFAKELIEVFLHREASRDLAGLLDVRSAVRLAFRLSCLAAAPSKPKSTGQRSATGAKVRASFMANTPHLWRPARLAARPAEGLVASLG